MCINDFLRTIHSSLGWISVTWGVNPVPMKWTLMHLLVIGWHIHAGGEGITKQPVVNSQVFIIRLFELNPKYIIFMFLTKIVIMAGQFEFALTKLSSACGKQKLYFEIDLYPVVEFMNDCNIIIFHKCPVMAWSLFHTRVYYQALCLIIWWKSCRDGP